MAIIFFVMGFCTLSFAQQIRFRVVSWNVENLFDIHHDSLKNDREFLPDALRHWNYTRYKKIHCTSRTWSATVASWW